MVEGVLFGVRSWPDISCRSSSEKPEPTPQVNQATHLVVGPKEQSLEGLLQVSQYHGIRSIYLRR